jgi:hypothetical protein
MSDGEEEDLRPPRTPEPWEALSDEEDRVEENTENEDSDLEGAVKIKFRKHFPWQQIARWSKTGKSEEDVQALILQAATDQLKPWIPSYKELHNRKDTDLYCWNRKETYTNQRGVCTTYRCCMKHTCNCPCMLRVIRNDNAIIVEIKHEHNANSHREDHSRFMKHLHKQAVVTAVQRDPTVSASSIRRASKKDIPIPLEYRRSVEYFVRNAKKQVVTTEMSGITLDGTTASFQALKEHLWLKTAVQRLPLSNYRSCWFIFLTILRYFDWISGTYPVRNICPCTTCES